MSQHDRPSHHEQRRASRFGRLPDSTFAAVITEPGREILAEVHDESLGGLGLLLPEQQSLSIGQQVSIVFAGAFLAARVVHIEPHDDGRILAGFTCAPITAGSSDPAPLSLPIATVALPVGNLPSSAVI